MRYDVVCCFSMTCSYSSLEKGTRWSNSLGAEVPNVYTLLQQGHLWFAGNVVPVGQEDMGKKKSGQQRGQFHNVVQIYRTM
jgi:hypothetical protein